MMRKKNLLFKIIPFLFLRNRIRNLKSDPDPVKSRPDPQHWTRSSATGPNSCMHALAMGSFKALKF